MSKTTTTAAPAPAPTPNILAPIAALALPDAAPLTTRAQQTLAFIEDFTIDSDEAYGLAGDELKAIKARAAALEGQRTGITGPINTALRAINALFSGPAQLLTQAEATLKRKMLAYDDEKRRLAEEARRKAEAEAAAERRRLAELAAAAERAASEQRAAAAAAAAAGNSTAAEVAAAAAVRAAAEAQGAAAEAQMVTAAVVVAPAPRVAGVSTRMQIDFDITSVRLLVAYIVTGKVFAEGDPALEHPELLSLIQVDEVRLRSYVRGLGLACNLPGVRVYEKPVMSARAA